MIRRCPRGTPAASCELRFPDCWNGRDLDSADHRRHMAYSRRRPLPAKPSRAGAPSCCFVIDYPTRGCRRRASPRARASPSTGTSSTPGTASALRRRVARCLRRGHRLRRLRAARVRRSAPDEARPPLRPVDVALARAACRLLPAARRADASTCTGRTIRRTSGSCSPRRRSTPSWPTPTGEAARRRRDARLFVVSLAFLVAAGFLGLHALATPGVLLDRRTAGFVIATPVGLAAAAALRRRLVGRVDARRAPTRRCATRARSAGRASA